MGAMPKTIKKYCIKLLSPQCKMESPNFDNTYFLSTDYEKLWDLIKNGHRIAGWVFNNRLESWDIVEVKFRGKYMIGTRGIGYESCSDLYKDFKSDCESIFLHYIPISN